jgi:hypothetical protein
MRRPLSRYLPRSYAVMVAGAALCLSACSPAMATSQPTPTVTADPLSVLRHRPLHLPQFALGAPCPRAVGRQVVPTYGIAIGDGPAYAVGLGTEDILMYAGPHNFGGGEYGGDKVLWIVSPAYRDLVLIRGQQVDGSLDVRFDTGVDPPKELSFTADGGDPGGWTGVPSYTRVKAPGCYAYQVDGLTFSEIIIFQAAPFPVSSG